MGAPIMKKFNRWNELTIQATIRSAYLAFPIAWGEEEKIGLVTRLDRLVLVSALQIDCWYLRMFFPALTTVLSTHLNSEVAFIVSALRFSQLQIGCTDEA